MDEQLDVLPYSLITVCLYTPVNVMPDYHRYGLRVGEWTAKFSQGGGDLSLRKKHTFQSWSSPTLIPGFVTGRLVRECRGLYHQYFPSRWGIVIFKDANPHLPPSQPIPVVVRHYINGCIIRIDITTSDT